jgi:hypothetical protein
MYMLRAATQTVAPSGSSHIAAWFGCLPSVSLSSGDKRGKAKAVLSTGDFGRKVDRVKAITVYHVFPVASRPVVSDSVAHVKGVLKKQIMLDFREMNCLHRS